MNDPTFSELLWLLQDVGVGEVTFVCQLNSPRDNRWTVTVDLVPPVRLTSDGKTGTDALRKLVELVAGLTGEGLTKQ